ncbi:MAG TPA: hypothetical protein VIE43_18020 [Thermoanaerobaculia bacterium]|jgi:hypothetical protein|nr:hypothetical protein [Thermoanaerobaculia bacterium]
MSWIVILGIVVVAIAFLATIGFRTKGGRQVGSTHLMTAARICLGIFLVILILIAVGVFK